MENAVPSRFSYGKVAFVGILAGSVSAFAAELVGAAHRVYWESLDLRMAAAGLAVAFVGAAFSTTVVMLAVGLRLRNHRLLLLFGTLSQGIVVGAGFYAWHAFPFVVSMIAVMVTVRRLGFLEGWVGVVGPTLLPLVAALVILFDYELQSWIWGGFPTGLLFTAAWFVSLIVSVGGGNAMIRAREARFGAT